MDAVKSTRAYNGYTIRELEFYVKCGHKDKDKMQTEINARREGTSVARVTPQIKGGKPISRVGRM